MIVNVKGRNIEIDDELARKYKEIFKYELSQTEIVAYLVMQCDLEKIDNLTNNEIAEKIKKSLINDLRWYGCEI